MKDRSSDIRFFLDYISSNAYLAWHEIHRLAESYGRRVEPTPVLFAGLLNAHGQLGPAEVLPKALWMNRNVHRKAALLGIQLKPPASHPFNPLLALRVSSIAMEESIRRKLIDALFRAVWSEGADVMDPRVISAIAATAGLDGDKAVAEAGTQEVKDRLRSETESAIGAGVFGVPTLIVDDELFWGYDDFPFLERFLAGRDPLDREALQAWFGVRPSVTRRRPDQSS